MTRRLLLVAALALLLGAAPAPADDDPLDPAGAPAPVRRAVFRAEAAYGRDDAAEAIATLEDALADRHDHPSLRYRLGLWLVETGRAADALPHLQRAAEQAPRAAAAWTALAHAAHETGEHARAARAFEQAAAAGDGREPPDPALRYYAGVSWLLAEAPGRAVDILAPLTAAVPDTVPQPWVQALISAAADADAPARAGDAARRLVRNHPDRPSAWVLAAQQAQLAGDLATAALRLQVADWLARLRPGEVRQLADLYGAAGLPRQAARTYARLWPDRPDLARPLAVSWLQAHEPDSARVVLARALAADPDPDLLVLLGDLEFEVGDHRAAREAYARATDRDPDRARAWLMQGVASLELDDHHAAREALGRAASFEATAGEARRLLRHLDDLAD